jgi:hypothetical protein
LSSEFHISLYSLASRAGKQIQAYFYYLGRLAVSCTSLYLVDDQRVRSIDLTEPLIAQNGILAAAGQRFTVSGCNLASATIAADATRPLPAILGDAVVTVNGLLASLVSVKPHRDCRSIASRRRSG